MRKLLLLLLLGSAFTRLDAQTSGPTPPAALPGGQAYESQVSYQKTRQQAALIDLPYAPDIVESSVKDYMGRMGWRGSGSRGYTVFRNVRIADTAKDLCDLHIRVDRKNKDRNAAVITALVVPAGQDPATITARDPHAIDNGKAFLEKMAPAITAGDLEARIKAQETTTKKAQGKLTDLRDDQVSLEKKIKNTQADLDQNKTDQLSETKTMQSGVNGNNDEAVKKSHKKMDKLISNQNNLQEKLQKYQASLEQNKKDQFLQEATSRQQQTALDSLRGLRKN